MRRRSRLLLTVVALAAGAAIIVALTSMSSAASGPLSSVLARLSAGVSAVESRVRLRIRGPGRAATLRWLDRSDSSLRAPSRMLLGAYDGHLPASLDGIVALEQKLGKPLAVIQVYTAWGDKPEHKYPLVVSKAIWDMGSVPMITWEPWLTEFDGRRHTHLPLREARDSHGLAAVAAGAYDFYIDEWAQAAARFGNPVFVRFAHEMNDPYRYPWGPQNNTKEEFIAAWQRVVTRFRAAGATNVIWVWSPHVAYEYWDLYYPGSGTVDWVATGVLNFGPIAQWSRWWSFDEIFGSRYDKLAAFRKPVMVAEFGSLAVGGDRAEWYRDALGDMPEKYPAIKSVLFFETGADQTVTYQKVDWRLTADSISSAAVAEAIRPWAPPETKR